MSTPRSTRWVAKLWRSTCAVTRLERPASFAARARRRARQNAGCHPAPSPPTPWRRVGTKTTASSRPLWGSSRHTPSASPRPALRPSGRRQRRPAPASNALRWVPQVFRQRDNSVFVALTAPHLVRLKMLKPFKSKIARFAIPASVLLMVAGLMVAGVKATRSYPNRTEAQIDSLVRRGDPMSKVEAALGQPHAKDERLWHYRNARRSHRINSSLVPASIGIGFNVSWRVDMVLRGPVPP